MTNDSEQKTSMYQPVSCDMHSELEVLIMHNSKVKIKWQDGIVHEAVLRVLDLQTKHGAEYLHARNDDNELTIIRLDTIHDYNEITS